MQFGSDGEDSDGAEPHTISQLLDTVRKLKAKNKILRQQFKTQNIQQTDGNTFAELNSKIESLQKENQQLKNDAVEVDEILDQFDQANRQIFLLKDKINELESERKTYLRVFEVNTINEAIEKYENIKEELDTLKENQMQEVKDVENEIDEKQESELDVVSYHSETIVDDISNVDNISDQLNRSAPVYYNQDMILQQIQDNASIISKQVEHQSMIMSLQSELDHSINNELILRAFITRIVQLFEIRSFQIVESVADIVETNIDRIERVQNFIPAIMIQYLPKIAELQYMKDRAKQSINDLISFIPMMFKDLRSLFKVYQLDTSYQNDYMKDQYQKLLNEIYILFNQDEVPVVMSGYDEEQFEEIITQTIDLINSMKKKHIPPQSKKISSPMKSSPIANRLAAKIRTEIGEISKRQNQQNE